MIVLAMIVFMAANYLRAARWRVLFVNGTVSTNRLFVVQNIGIGLNNVVPIRVASEAVQLAILTLRDRVRPSVALATLGMERVLDLVVSAAILGAALLLIPEMDRFALYIWAAIGIAVVSVVIVRLLAWGSTSVKWSFEVSLSRRLSERRQRPGEGAYTPGRVHRHDPRVLAAGWSHRVDTGGRD